MTKAVGFIGLGVMGFPMAGHLSEHNKLRYLTELKPNLKFGLLNTKVKFVAHLLNWQKYLMSSFCVLVMIMM